MSQEKRLLITGATGKVGNALIKSLLADERFSHFSIRALCHNRELPFNNNRIETIKGSIENKRTVEEAIVGVTHVVHLATCKETPEQIMDVAVKGLFWLLESCRESPLFEQFILIGGDAAVGHFYYAHPRPVTETQKHSAYPGCYALSKVLEETMLEQYYYQYQLNGCCLRAPWIMEKDDFKYSLSFGEDVFGGPRWCDLVGKDRAQELAKANTIPVMLDPEGVPVKRNFIHLQDLVAAILIAIDHPAAFQQTFNISMNEPIDYGKVSQYLAENFGYPSIDIATPYFSTWLDNTKAQLILGWEPEFTMEKLIDEAWAYQRKDDEPRKIWYPG